MLFEQYTQDTYRWGIWKVTETIEELLSLLPDRGECYAGDLARFKSEFRKIEWLAVRVLLYTLTGEVKTIHYMPNGKPYLSDSEYISISHTKGYVSVILSQTNEVGIDIEKYGERVQKVAHKFVRADENVYPESPHYTTTLLLIWSAKETMFKCMNQSDVDFREHLYVAIPPIGQNWMMARETRTEQHCSFRIYFMSHPDFVMTWTIVNECPECPDRG